MMVGCLSPASCWSTARVSSGSLPPDRTYPEKKAQKGLTSLLSPQALEFCSAAASPHGRFPALACVGPASTSSRPFWLLLLARQRAEHTRHGLLRDALEPSSLAQMRWVLVLVRTQWRCCKRPQNDVHGGAARRLIRTCAERLGR